jgi:hypothetical protein
LLCTRDFMNALQQEPPDIVLAESILLRGCVSLDSQFLHFKDNSSAPIGPYIVNIIQERQVTMSAISNLFMRY